jgi:hypothetical protein
MNIISKLKTQTHNYFLQKELDQTQIKRESIDFENAKNIGILFNATELADRQIVLDFSKELKNQGKKVKLMGFLNDKDKNANHVFDHFNKSDLDWALRPKQEGIETFIKQRFDILINLSTTSHPSLDYIAAFSHAKFRVGPFTEKIFCYELMIEVDEQKDLKSFLNQVSFFLKKMKTTHEPAI